VLFFDELCQTASAEISVPAERAFTYLADPRSQGEWTLGAWDRRVLGDGLSSGTSLVSGEEVFIRTEADAERLLVDYWVGSSPERLRRSISARVVPGEAIGRDAATCVVTLMAWRADSREAWLATAEIHHLEMRMIKARLEQRS
jgi:hypothetical protein